MRKPSSFSILAAGAAWRLLGARGPGETLLAALAGEDEQNRMLAGMSLVRGGQRSFELIERKLRAGKASAAALRLLPDIDESKSRAVMEQVVEHGPDELRGTARDCLDLLDRMEASESDAE